MFWCSQTVSCVAKTVEDPSGPQTSGKNTIVRHTIPVVKDANENLLVVIVVFNPCSLKFVHFSEKKSVRCSVKLPYKSANEKCLRELEKKNSTSSTPLPKKHPSQCLLSLVWLLQSISIGLSENNRNKE